MAATMRGTPTFVPPATQNTAPVHEFRCLYTHDVRKKAKKWHDGSTRFHTFNKRVMVYDDTKNFIGDLHYRADEEFGEGIELQLDRGVLVEVGERIGETQTDLTGVIHRQHADTVSLSTTAASLPPPPPSRIQRGQIAAPQGRPKSLAELLGTPQGRHGRAQIPTQSPFEQRQALSLSIDQSTRPPAKRQKIAAGKENDHPTLPPVQSERSPVNPPQERPKTLQNKIVPRRQQQSTTRTAVTPPNMVRNVINISSDDEVPVPLGFLSSGSRDMNSIHSVQRNEKRSATNTHDNDKMVNKQRNDNYISSSHAIDGQIRQQEPGTKPVGTNTSTSKSTGRSSSSRIRPRMSSLKMVPSKKRIKLMYKALLPSTALDQPSGGLPVSGEQRPHETDPIMCGSGTNAIFEINDLDDIISPPTEPTVQPQVSGTPPTMRNSAPESPLFVSQSLSQRSPPPVEAFVEDEFNMLATQTTGTPRNLFNADSTSNVQRASNIEDHLSETGSPMFSHSRPKIIDDTPSPIQPVPSSPPSPLLSELPFMDAESAVAQPQSSEGPTLRKTKSLARCLSENDPPLPYDPRASPLRGHQQVEEVTRINVARPFPPRPIPQPPVQCARTPSLAKSPLHRSNSDTATIAPNVITVAESSVTSPQLNSDEQGPWTKLEAFLLFDKWPDCKVKDKPIFKEKPPTDLDDSEFDHDGADDDDDDDRMNLAPHFVKARTLHAPPIIRSARHVLRDEY